MLFVIALFSYSCHSSVYTEFSGSTMGTTYSIKIVESPIQTINTDSMQREIDSLLLEINKRMSTYIDSSEISRFNAYSSLNQIVVSTELYELTEKAIAIFKQTSGSFDPTVQALVELWGFGGQFNSAQLPDSDKIGNILKHVGADKIIVENGKLQKKDILLKLDLSGIAKGWGVDQLGHLLTNKGFINFMVEIGGEILVSGSNKDNKPWQIGIRSPYKGELGLFSTISISNKALATSGSYQNYFTWEEADYSHIINPLTGYPIKHELVSASIIADDCTTADAIATAVMVRGLEKGLELIESLDGIEGYMIGIDTKGGFKSIWSKSFPINL